MNSLIEQPQFNIENIKLIVGLGNPGREYLKTRHNAGFIFLDSFNLNFLEEKKFKAEVANLDINSNKLIAAKPLTFMNDSGESVNSIKTFYKINSDQILIIHDDLDIKLGEYKLQFNKGPKVHNGIASIENHLSTAAFWRLRIGIDNRDEVLRNNISGADYVLGRFSASEIELLNQAISNAKELLV